MLTLFARKKNRDKEIRKATDTAIESLMNTQAEIIEIIEEQQKAIAELQVSCEKLKNIAKGLK